MAALTRDGVGELLFCENETNSQRLFGTANASPYVKDGFNDFLVEGAPRRQPGARPGPRWRAHHVLSSGRASSASCASG